MSKVYLLTQHMSINKYLAISIHLSLDKAKARAETLGKQEYPLLRPIWKKVEETWLMYNTTEELLDPWYRLLKMEVEE